jgi:hypothetical protein
MTKRNRETLKKRFGDGEMPSSADFADLIESVLNIHDDGILYNDRDGLRLTQIGPNRVLSLYGAIEEKSPVWSFGLDTHRSCLTLDVGQRRGRREDARGDDDDGGGYAVLTLLAPDDDAGAGSDRARVGINTRAPRHELDVNGVVASTGRIGAAGASVDADAEWHRIGGPYQGCTALEIMAGVGRPKEGKYALLHAYALRTFDAKGEITYHQAHYGSRRHRMQLRWVDDDSKNGNYYLELRVNCAYGAGTAIRYYLTTLWFDPLMRECGAAAAETGAA